MTRTSPLGGVDAQQREVRCLRCGHPVSDHAAGCKGAHCPNCKHPYPLGDCSD